MAQTTGTIRGQIRDEEGSPLPGVTVTATSQGRGLSRTVVTGENGSYALPSLVVETYDVTAQLEGFQEQVIENVRVGITSTVTLDLTMALVLVEESITVSSVPVLDVTSSAVGSNYTGELIDELPTSRNFWDLMVVSPGMSRQSEGSTSISAFGSSIASNTWNIDGLDTTNADTGNAFWWPNPDTIEEIQVLAIGAPAQYGNMSGAAMNVVTKSGTNDFRGSANLWYQDDSLTGDNAEINGIPFHRDEFHDVSLSLGGPLKQDQIWFFAAYQNYRDSYTEPGENPDFPNEFPSDRFDVKINAALSASTTLEAKYHYEYWPWKYADPFSTPSASGKQGDTNPAWGLGIDSLLGSSSLLEVNYAGYSGTDNWLSRTGSQEDPFIDYSPPDNGPPRFSGSLWYPYKWDLGRDQIDASLSTHADDFLKGDHEFKFGITYGTGDGDTITAGGINGRYYYRYEYTYEYYGYEYTYPYYYRVTARAYHYGAETETTSAFVDDSWRVTDKLTINVGVRYDEVDSDIPSYPKLGLDWQPTGEKIPGIKNAVTWSHFSPRLGFAYQVGQNGVLRGFYGKFYDGNVTGNWYAPPPDAPSYLYEFSAGRNGPWTPFFTFEWDENSLDPNLQPPETDQFTVGYEHRLGTDYTLGFQWIYKETENLIGWEILGDGVYEMVPWVNPFTGEVQELASIVEQPTVRKGNRPGDGSLAPPGQLYEQDFTGAFVTLNKRYSDGWSLFASYTWSDSNGFLPRPQSQGQGDPFYTSTGGRDPNNWLNAKQALQNEREHVFQVQATFDLPWELRGTTIYSFLDGKPYSRQVTAGSGSSQFPLNQGGQTVIALPASSNVTLPSQNILDLSLGRGFQAGATEIRFDIQLLNALNEDAHDWWATLNVPPGSQYTPSGYLFPRRWMLRLGVTF